MPVVATAAVRAFCSFLSDKDALGHMGAAGNLRRALQERGRGLSAGMVLLLESVCACMERSKCASGGDGGNLVGTGVYSDGADAFELFISNGGNTGMYCALGRALVSAWPAMKPWGEQGWSLLDVGTGSGLGLAPALALGGRSGCGISAPTSLALVEPSPEMLRAGLDRIRPVFASCPAKTLEYFPLTLQDFQGLHHDRKWDVCQATFSLQSLRPKERSQALHWLASRCDHFLLVEFDVPAIVCDRTSTVRARAPERVAALLEAYARGAAEYLPAAQQPGGSSGKLRRKECKRVVEGFLVPMLLSCFGTVVPESDEGAGSDDAPHTSGDDSSSDNTGSGSSGATTVVNYEQPMSSWVKEVQAAGFTDVQTAPIFNYWWAPAFLIRAKGAARPPTTMASLL